MIRPTLRQMEYLVALYEEESFSRAAERCFVTQSTLSAGIKELEQALGRPLVARGQRKKVMLTPLGREVMLSAREILLRTEDMLARVRALDTPLSGLLRLGVIPTIAPYFLPRILPALQAEFPKLRLSLQEDLSDRLLDKLQRGQLDVLLMAFPYETPGLEQSLLFREPFVVACAKGEAHPPFYTPETLDPKRLLLLEDGHCLRDHALRACKIVPERPQGAFSATSLLTLVQMVQHGFGMTLLPEMATGEGMLPDSIALVPFSGPETPSRDIGLAWQKNAPYVRDFKALSACLERMCGRL